MKKQDLIDELNKLPDNSYVYFYTKLGSIDYCDRVWLAREPLAFGNGNRILISDHQAVILETEDRPVNAPTKEEEKHWRIAKYVS